MKTLVRVGSVVDRWLFPLRGVIIIIHSSQLKHVMNAPRVQPLVESHWQSHDWTSLALRLCFLRFSAPDRLSDVLIRRLRFRLAAVRLYRKGAEAPSSKHATGKMPSMFCSMSFYTGISLRDCVPNSRLSSSSSRSTRQTWRGPGTWSSPFSEPRHTILFPRQLSYYQLIEDHVRIYPPFRMTGPLSQSGPFSLVGWVRSRPPFIWSWTSGLRAYRHFRVPTERTHSTQSKL